MKASITDRRSVARSRARRALLAVLAAAALTATVWSAGSSSWELDTFESPIRVVQPLETAPRTRYLWGLNSDNGVPGASLTDVVTSTRHDGAQSLHNRFDQVLGGGRNWQFMFYPYTIDSLGLSPNGWQWMRNLVTDPSTWPIGQVNRLRLWMKIPPTTPTRPTGQFNFEVGTFLREVSAPYTDPESNNWHFYHLMNLYGTGEWEQLILDTHPSHQRAANGNADRGDHRYPSTATPNYTYFDLMTWFYLDFPYVTWPSNPNDFYVDSVTPYIESAIENVDQVYALHAGYVPSSNLIRVGWNRYKDDSVTKHEVRYAFTDIHASGWNSATAAPNGVITPPDGGGYNGMEWSTNAINLSGRTMVYIAIKPQNSALFRQIAIPVVSNPGPGSGPAPPTGVQVVP